MMAALTVGTWGYEMTPPGGAWRGRWCLRSRGGVQSAVTSAQGQKPKRTPRRRYHPAFQRMRRRTVTPDRVASHMRTTMELDTNRNPWCAHLPIRYTSKMVASVVCELP